MYKTILVPLDGSHRAETILAHAEALAKAFSAKIVLLQVIEPNVSVVTPYDMVPYYDPKEAERMTTESKGYLATKEGDKPFPDGPDLSLPRRSGVMDG